MQKLIVEQQVIKNVSSELGNMDFYFFQYLKNNYIWEEANFLDTLNTDAIRYQITVSLKRRVFKKRIKMK